MKKARVFIIVMLLIVSTFSMSYAAIVPPETIAPHYVGAAAVSRYFDIDNNGTAEVMAALIPKAEGVVDRVTVSVVVKNSIGSIVANKNYNATWRSVAKQFEVIEEFNLPARGTYTCVVSFKAYLDGRLLETITTPTVLRSY